MVEYLLARRCARRARGQSMVELALTLPLLFLILFGVIDLGRWSMAYVTIANASREGARFGMTDHTNSAGITTAANNEAIGVTFDGVVIECSLSGGSYSSANCGSAQPGDRIRVTVNYTFQFATLYLFGLSNIPISDYTTMVIVK